MTPRRLLPWLILPASVALLQVHGIAYWTERVTGAWPGWGTPGFWAAWGAWGWSVLLELLNLWAWAEVARPTRVGAAWRGLGWQALAGATTLLLVLGPLIQVSAPLVGEAAQVRVAINQAARWDAAQQTLIAASGQGRRVGQQLLDATRAANQAEAQAFGAQPRAWALRENWQRVVTVLLQLAVMILGVLGAVLSIQALVAPIAQIERLPRKQEGAGSTPTSRIVVGTPSTGGKWQSYEGRIKPEHEIKIQFVNTETPVEAAARNEKAAVGIQTVDLANDADEQRGRGKQRAGLDHPGGEAHSQAGQFVPAPQREVETDGKTFDAPGESAAPEPEAADPEPALTARVRLAREGYFRAFAGRKADDAAVEIGVRPADLSFLMNHEARAQKKARDGRTRIISEPALVKIEQAVRRRAAPALPGLGALTVGTRAMRVE